MQMATVFWQHGAHKFFRVMMQTLSKGRLKRKFGKLLPTRPGNGSQTAASSHTNACQQSGRIQSCKDQSFSRLLPLTMVELSTVAPLKRHIWTRMVHTSRLLLYYIYAACDEARLRLHISTEMIPPFPSNTSNFSRRSPAKFVPISCGRNMIS